MKVITGNHYLAFVLDEETKEAILSDYSIRFDVIRCDHVTIAHSFEEIDVPSLQAFVDSNPTFTLNGFVKADGIDLFRVLVNGQSARPLGGEFHLTYTRREDRQSSDSNRVLSGEIESYGKMVAGMRLKGEFKLIPIE